MPNFRSSLYPFTSPNEIANNEFFIYSPSMNEEYIIRLYSNYAEGSIKIDLHKANGEYISSKIHYPTGKKEYINIDVGVSKNGKYLYYLYQHDRPQAMMYGQVHEEMKIEEDKQEEEKEEDKEPQLRKIEGGRTKDKQNPLFEVNGRFSLKIFEISFVRRKSLKKKLDNLKKKMKILKQGTSIRNKVHKRVTESEMMVELKLVREFKH